MISICLDFTSLLPILERSCYKGELRTSPLNSYSSFYPNDWSAKCSATESRTPIVERSLPQPIPQTLQPVSWTPQLPPSFSKASLKAKTFFFPAEFRLKGKGWTLFRKTTSFLSIVPLCSEGRGFTRYQWKSSKDFFSWTTHPVNSKPIGTTRHEKLSILVKSAWLYNSLFCWSRKLQTHIRTETHTENTHINIIDKNDSNIDNNLVSLWYVHSGHKVLVLLEPLSNYYWNMRPIHGAHIINYQD